LRSLSQEEDEDLYWSQVNALEDEDR